MKARVYDFRIKAFIEIEVDYDNPFDGLFAGAIEMCDHEASGEKCPNKKKGRQPC